uniref:Uncharacterized protein n=1 Tax=Hemiselmis andersenii TaxID=464988 RepID=A0A6U4YEG3_HEMAN|mmetsp:Transcript_6575/g.15172  ORF Transcript_6575/g.15172 Transcript_6575/m.15172 type:complete len:281 (-) Transcript_6575:123-965(-)
MSRHLTGLGNGYGTVLQPPATPAPPAAAAAAGAPAAAGAESDSGVSFPADFPNSVKHFLLLGCIAMAVMAGVALAHNVSRAKMGAVHSLLFLAGAAGGIGYFAMVTGLGVDLKTIDETPRVVFWARYATQVASQPLLLAAVGSLAQMETAVLVPLVVEDILLVMAGYLGSTTIAPMKYFWWLTSCLFTVLIGLHLLSATKGGHAVLRNAAYGVIACLAAFQILWLMGSEGTANLGLAPEVGLYVVVDIVLKLGLGLYLLFSYDAVAGKEEGQEVGSASYV